MTVVLFSDEKADRRRQIPHMMFYDTADAIARLCFLLILKETTRIKNESKRRKDNEYKFHFPRCSYRHYYPAG